MPSRAALRSASLACLCLSSLLPVALAATPPVSARGESEKLHRLLDQGWESKLRDRPEFATYIGFPGHNHLWTDLSAAGFKGRQASTRKQLEAARSIDRGLLAPPEQVDLDLYVRRLAAQVEGFSFPEDEVTITRYGGLQQDVPYALAKAPAASSRDYDDLIARLKGVEALVDQTLALLQKGLAAGVTPPKSLLLGVPDQVRALTPDDPWKSPLLAPFRQIGSNIDDEDAPRIKSAALYAYEKKAAPAFRKLLQYLTTTYIPAARESVGLGALPDGAAWYAYRLRKVTTTDLTPQQVHELGLSEVRRIRAEMDRIRAATGFAGSFADFVRFLHTDPRFFYAQPDDLLEGYRTIAKQVDARLPSLFGTVPALPLRIAAIPADEAPGKSTIYYDIGSVARDNPGTCYVNTYDLKARPKWEMTALYLHECMPGHHLQVTIAQTIRKAPKVLNYHDYTPFVEGWGVYAETLGDEMGLYTDPYVKFGQLASELWRAMRVVVDTGIHSQGWTRQQAVDFFREQTAQDDRAIDNEIERYLYDPGLGVAYTVGEVKLRELRSYSQKELGTAFDPRAFHDEVLRHGALPLDLVEENVRGWVKAKKGTPSPPAAATFAGNATRGGSRS
ncbi:MAG TPA: DUF885 domain-containing protein [Thermoanaerobaculia bacterium]|jgi:uncharacterized protein (DUF885 family)|nr:DUF885 domain-containing protein [Thermoanaerobaculia bacterium]